VGVDDETHRRRYAEAIHDARAGGGDAFQSWFNRTDTEEEALRRGHWDFALHILTPAACSRLADPGSLTALEIGYGGGRLLNAAACHFGRAVGIDIHHEEAEVRALFERLGRDNVELHTTDGSGIPLEDGSVDFVYSFIVLQHLPRYESFVRYVEETHRVLSPRGVAQLFYGRLRSRDPRRRYRELPDAKVNHTSLELAPRHAAAVSRAAGFEVVDSGGSYKNVPDGYPGQPGGQGYVTLVKG